MPPPAVLVTRKLPSQAMALLEASCDVDLFEGAGTMPGEELLRRVVGKQALVAMLTDRVDRAVFEAARDLRVVANVAVGYNNIDIPAARERGVLITNTPGVLTEATADFTWALILAVTRRLCEGERIVRRGGWTGWTFDFLPGTEVRGKQIGIVGYGRIGRAVAARAVAFGMTLAYVPRPSEAKHAGTGPPAEAMPLDRLLATSDVVSLHVPLTPETTHLIDQPALARMRRTAFLINTSRGPVVDEAALAWALKNSIISGAALDVYEREPEIHPDLLPLENVVLAPHMASGTRETRGAMADLAVRNVLAVVAGQPPLTPVL
jgi:glyoxylate reductase